MQERKKYVRASGLIGVKYKISKLPAQGQTRALDISGEGIRILINTKSESARLPESKTIVELEIILAGDSLPILAKGEVVWSSIAKTQGDKIFFDTGIRFIELKGYDRDRITKYVLHSHRKK